MLKIGDKVIYVKHHEFCIKSDSINFEIGKIYEITDLADVSIEYYGGVYVKNEGKDETFLYPNQFKTIVPNNKLSRVLYPNWVQHGKYLIPEDI
jgi:hypothetical protein